MPRKSREEREALMSQIVHMRRVGMTFQQIADSLGLSRRQEARLLWIAHERAVNDEQCLAACRAGDILSPHFPPSPAMAARLRREFGDGPFERLDNMRRSVGDMSEQEPF